jgi:hypothetical protein
MVVRTAAITPPTARRIFMLDIALYVLAALLIVGGLAGSGDWLFRLSIISGGK